MSTRTIIPGLWVEIEQPMIKNFLNAVSVVNLSRVSKIAQISLSNEFFKSYLISHYPCLETRVNEEKEARFKHLSTFLPHYCWKMTCVFMDQLYYSEHPSKISFAFFKECAAPSIRGAVEAKKRDCESKLKEICGSHSEDPESPINKAWVSIQGTLYIDHISRQKELFDSLKELPLQEMLEIKKSVLKWRESGELPDTLTDIDSTNIFLEWTELCKNELELPRDEGYVKYRNYQDLEITRAEKQMEFERHNRRLPNFYLPPSLSEAETLVLKAYELSESFVSPDREREWVASMTKHLPNQDLIKNFTEEFQITRASISAILIEAWKWNNQNKKREKPVKNN